MKITTKSGDCWDSIAKRVYGSEAYAHILQAANFKHRFVSRFSHGVTLEAPEAEPPAALNLPPWKRKRS